jgi:putative addiction module component (TIGR02574 family)
MTPASRKLFDEALALPEEERLALATDLIASIDGPADAGWDEAWATELERRDTKFSTGFLMSSF